MNYKLHDVFIGIVSDEILECIIDEFEEVADFSILQLGVDSLAIMKIIFRLEDILNIEVDYENFDIKQISTPRLIREIIVNGKL